MRHEWFIPCVASAILAVLPFGLRAEVLLYPNGATASGELSGAAAGAWTALAAGADALFVNPAGLASERGGALSVGADLIRFYDGSGEERVDAGPGYVALLSGPRRRGESLPNGFGWFAHWPVHRELDLAAVTQETILSEDIPTGIDPGGLDVFADGIEQLSHRAGGGRFWVVASGFAFAVEPAGWFRIGGQLVWERVDFAQHDSALNTLAAGNGEPPNPTYSASIQEEFRVAGRADRWYPVIGVQARPAAGIALGAVTRFPSNDLGGEGSAFYSRTSRATLQSGSAPTIALDDLIFGEADGGEFRLRTPLETTFSIAFATSRMAFEIDVIRSHGLGSYTVLELPESAPPSTSAFRPPEFRTGTQPRTRWATAFSIATDNSTVFALGARDDSSGIPGQDRVFRSIDLYTVTGGVVITRGALAFAFGFSYQAAPRQSVSFPSVLGDTQEQQVIQLQEFTLRFGASWVL